MTNSLTVKQVAERMKVSVKTVYRLIESRLLLAKKIGRCVRVDERDYAAFIAQAQTASVREDVKKGYSRGPKYRDRGYRYLEGRNGKPKKMR